MTNKIIVSVIIPVREVSYYLLFETLPALDKQTTKNFEVIVLPNEQTLYDLTLLRQYRWLRIIPTGKITRPALKRNIGAEKAHGTILAFLDDDAYPPPRWIEKGIADTKPRTIGAVGGPGILPPHSGMFEKSFDEILTSYIGSGNYSYRFIPQKKRRVDDYPSMNFFVKKNIFTTLGGFNNDYWPGEDSKLCNDIVYKEKKQILYDPRVIVFHHRRNNLHSFLKQHANYGFHRGAFFAQGDTNSRRLAYLIPSMLVAYVLLLVLFIPIFLFVDKSHIIFILIPLLLYYFFVLIVFVSALIHTNNLLIAFWSSLTLVSMHFTYGILFFVGLLKGIVRKKNIYD